MSPRARVSRAVARSGGSIRCGGGRAPSSIRSIPARFRTRTATGSAISRASCARLHYLAELGVDALWLSPIFPSPMADFGYDISDYTDIDPLFGTLADFDALVAAAHRSGLKVILDLVPNHTSDQHPWFVGEPPLARRSAARLVHLARSGAGRRPAEQLAVRVRRQRLDSSIAPPASTTITPSCAEQPDLNWRNPRGPRRDARRDALLARRAASTASAST